jgi:transcriptional regulator of acetoin/glycerol metabolism
LRNAIEYGVISCSGPALRSTDLPPELTNARETEPTLEQALTSADERRRVTAALKLARGNRTAAARLLSISRATLYRRLTELRDLERPELRPLEQL